MKRFDLVTEADARMLEIGTTIELLPDGHITPLARDTLRARRITVVEAPGSAETTQLAPRDPIERLAIGCDHRGLALKQQLVRHLRSRGLAVVDLGVNSPEAVDYPDVAATVARAVSRAEADAGIVIDGGGVGSAIAANKVRGVRAAMAMNEAVARYSREHNGANVLTLGAALVTPDEALRIVDVWLATPMREPRYIRQLVKIQRLEE